MKIGFVGLGIMGHPMALNLIKGGHELFVYGKRRLPAEIREAGATICDTLKAIAEQAERHRFERVAQRQARAAQLDPDHTGRDRDGHPGKGGDHRATRR